MTSFIVEVEEANQYVLVEEPITILTNAVVVAGYGEWSGDKKLASDPNTGGWGTSESNRRWFNTTDYKHKMWNGAEIVLMG